MSFIHYVGVIPSTKFYIALSGGSDSMAILHFLSRYPKNNFECIHVNHGTEMSDVFEDFVVQYCTKNNITLNIHRIAEQKLKTQSKEEFWRIQRLAIFGSYDGDVITGHNLDDMMETYVMRCATGSPFNFHYRNKNVVRPFVYTKKGVLRDYCVRHGIPWVEDESNTDPKYTRNNVRHNILPKFLELNPSLHKVVLRKFNELNGLT